MNTENKNSYLNHGHVSDFVNFVRDCINNEHVFSHQYTINNNGSKNSSWISENSGATEWKCTSLQDAIRQYYWASGGFPVNKKSLDNLSQTLRAAYKQSLFSSEGNEAREIAELAFLSAAWKVLQWGGVTASNSAWLVEKASNKNLVNAFRESEKVLSNYDYHDKKTWFKKNQWTETKSAFRMNAGYTKVYSLLYDDFLIYDSRVAAALGKLVAIYCIKNHVVAVPNELKFPYMNAKEAQKKDAADKKNRNPSTATLSFDKLEKNSDHAMWNLHANWILSEAIDGSTIFDWTDSEGNKLVTENDALRVLEAALFMIGYDLGDCDR